MEQVLKRIENLLTVKSIVTLALTAVFAWQAVKGEVLSLIHISIIAACQNKQVPDTWNVGDSCMMAFGKKNYQIDIIGKNHDDYADGSGKMCIRDRMSAASSGMRPASVFFAAAPSAA